MFSLTLQLSAEVYPERHLASKGQAQDERENVLMAHKIGSI
jgi:hypothetical protein